MSALLVGANDLVLGHRVHWWIAIKRVLEMHQITDADQLAFKLLSRCTKEERQAVRKMLEEQG